MIFFNNYDCFRGLKFVIIINVMVDISNKVLILWLLINIILFFVKVFVFKCEKEWI